MGYVKVVVVVGVSFIVFKGGWGVIVLVISFIEEEVGRVSVVVYKFFGIGRELGLRGGVGRDEV